MGLCTRIVATFGCPQTGSPASIIIKGDLPARAHVHHGDLKDDKFSFLKTGVLHATKLSTVSRTYAKEIQTDEFGMGMQELLRGRSGDLVGIVNGVDYGEWNPATDPKIPHHFSVDDMAGKAKMKAALLDRFQLPHDTRAPVFGVVSRLTSQKGFELFADSIPTGDRTTYYFYLYVVYWVGALAGPVIAIVVFATQSNDWTFAELSVVLEEAEGNRVLLTAQEALGAIDRVEGPVLGRLVARRYATEVDPVECLIGTNVGPAHAANMFDDLVAGFFGAGLAQFCRIFFADDLRDLGVCGERGTNKRLRGEVGDGDGAAIFLFEGRGGHEVFLDALTDGSCVADGDYGGFEFGFKVDAGHGVLGAALAAEKG